MKEKFLKLLEEYCDFLENIKQYSTATIKTYHKPIQDAIEISEIYEEQSIIVFDITKLRISIKSQANKTVNKKLSSIRSFVKFCDDKNIKIKLVGANSVKSAQTLPKPIKTDTIFESLKEGSDEEKLIVLLIYSFGLRISELASLKLENINDNFIRVLGKGSKQREIPTNETVKSFIHSYVDMHGSKEFIFENEENKPYTIRQLQYRIEKIFKKIGIKATPHQLRHSFATDLLNEGARINDISELLGHSSLKATGIYTKLNTNIKLKQYNTSHPLSNLE